MKYLLFLLLPVFGNAQTFYVSGRDRASVNEVADKIKFEGYRMADSASADYIVNLLVDGSYNAMAIGFTFHGYIMITDRESNAEVVRTPMKGSSPALTNGYNASHAIFDKIDKKYLADALKKCPKKETVQSK